MNTSLVLKSSVSLPSAGERQRQRAAQRDRGKHQAQGDAVGDARAPTGPQRQGAV